MSQFSLFLKNKFNDLLLALVFIFVALPFIDKSAPGFLLLTFLYLVSLLLVMRAFIFRSGYYILYLLVAATALLFDYLSYSKSHLFSPQYLELTALSAHALLQLFAIIVILRQLYYHRDVSSDTMKGGICVYLLIGLFWGFLYAIVDTVNPASFSQALYRGNDLFYFSFVTLTTAGFGDITPVSDAAKTLTVFECVVGQMYIAIFIARLIGLLIAKDLRKEGGER